MKEGENIKKLEIFKEELLLIKNDAVRNFTEKALLMLPDYFYEIAASSTGKYHPKYALGNGGLIRHTKAAVAIAKDLLNLEMYSKYTQDEKDLMISSLILHDGMKHGEIKREYSVADHPKVVADWISKNNELNTLLPDEQISVLTGAICSHMGQWNTDYKTKKEILPKPKTAIQKMVHMCDYLASRKYLEFDFDGNYYEPQNYKDDPIDNLEDIIDEIINMCKTRIQNGEDRESIYTIIKEHNNGNKNPNSITELDIAKQILNKLEGK